jgi:hypothetical protein
VNQDHHAGRGRAARYRRLRIDVHITDDDVISTMRCAGKEIPKKKPQPTVTFRIDKGSGRSAADGQRQKADAQPY